MAHDSLLNIKQVIEDNLGSNQIIDTLDHFLNEALRGAIKYTPEFIDARVAQLLHIVGRDETRRSYSVDHDNMDVHAKLVQYFARKADKSSQIINAALDRVFIIDWLDKLIKALEEIKSYLTLKSEYSTDALSKCMFHFGSYTPIRNIRPALNNIKPHFDAAIEFRGWIMQKYYRLVYTYALSSCGQSNHMPIDLNDLYHNTIYVTVRTICKYSKNKGTLTQFIQLWMRSANALDFDHNIGHAYIMPISKLTSMKDVNWVERGVARSNIAFSLEDALDVSADMDGQISTNDAVTSREHETFLSQTISLSAYDKDIKTFARYQAIPYSTPAEIVNPMVMADLLEHAYLDTYLLDFEEPEADVLTDSEQKRLLRYNF